MDFVSAIVVGVFLGYFVLGEFLMGTVFRCGRHHRYPWEGRR